MNSFTALYEALGRTSDPNDQLLTLRRFISSASGRDRDAGLYLLLWPKIEAFIPVHSLLSLAAEASGYPGWLVDDSQSVVGDVAETAALLCGRLDSEDSCSAARFLQLVSECRNASPAARGELIVACWNEVSRNEAVLLNQLICGRFRTPIARELVVRALSREFDLPRVALEKAIAKVQSFEDFSVESLLLSRDLPQTSPYGFSNSPRLVKAAQNLGDVSDWVFEWCVSESRTQVVKRGEMVDVWDTEGRLLSSNDPGILEQFRRLADGTVLECWFITASVPFGTQKTTQRNVRSAQQVKCLPFDLLELRSVDLRSSPLVLRRRMLETLASSVSIEISSLLSPNTWEDADHYRRQAYENSAWGLLMRSASTTYDALNRTDYLWKPDRRTIHALLVYADQSLEEPVYTFAVHSPKGLVPIAKLPVDLPAPDMETLAQYIERNTIERFGRVRAVSPDLAFSIEFDLPVVSQRHKAGIALVGATVTGMNQRAQVDSLDTPALRLVLRHG